MRVKNVDSMVSDGPGWGPSCHCSTQKQLNLFGPSLEKNRNNYLIGIQQGSKEIMKIKPLGFLPKKPKEIGRAAKQMAVRNALPRAFWDVVVIFLSPLLISFALWLCLADHRTTPHRWRAPYSIIFLPPAVVFAQNSLFFPTSIPACEVSTQFQVTSSGKTFPSTFLAHKLEPSLPVNPPMTHIYFNACHSLCY